MRKSFHRIPDKHIVLVVDPDTAQAFLEYFAPRYHCNSDKGFYMFHLAESGLAALNLCTGDKGFLVVVLDAQLPDMTSKEFLFRLRRKEDEKWNPTCTRVTDFIILVEKEEPLDKRLQKALGRVIVLTKPFALEEVERLLRLLRMGEHHSKNSITYLPTGMLIEKRLRSLLSEQEWALLYIGIDGFESFEDSYGWKEGEQVLRFVADLIEETVDEYSAITDFIGHIGGDDFVAIISRPEKAEILALQLQARFANDVQKYYPADNTAPQLKFMVGILRSTDGPFADIREITERSAKARQQARASE